MYRKKPTGWLKYVDFILLDLLCLELALVISYLLRHGYGSTVNVSMYRNMSVLLLLIDLAVTFILSTYGNVARRGYYQEFVKTVNHVAIVTMISVFYLFLSQESDIYSRMVLLLTCGIYFALTYCTRILWKEFLKQYTRKGIDRSLLLLTTHELVRETLLYMKEHNDQLYMMNGVAILDEIDASIKEIDGIPIVAVGEGIVEYVCREWVDEIFIMLPTEQIFPKKMVEQFSEMGITTHVRLMNIMNLTEEPQYVQTIYGLTFLTTSIRYVTTKQLIWKRMLDIIGGIVGSIIAVCLTLIVGPMIYISSPGPIFFKQERVGRNGKHFFMYKFRSMYMDAEKRKQDLMKENRVADGMMFKLDFDPRIIGAKKLADGTIKKGLGNFIRDYSIDEFPQFFNVLKGDMSLVGTRPPTLDEWEKYDLHHRTRLAIKPGITGKWQISGRSNITEFEEVLRLDNEYIQEWSIALDLRIILKTIVSVLHKEGSM